MNRPPSGVIGIAVFFGFGAIMASLAARTLVMPGSNLQNVWRLNPQAHDGLLAMGSWGVGLMAVVAVACATTSVGLMRGEGWGRWVAIMVLAVNLLGDIGSALYRGDPRTLIGVPIGAALIAYLLSRRVHSYFQRAAVEYRIGQHATKLGACRHRSSVGRAPHS